MSEEASVDELLARSRELEQQHRHQEALAMLDQALALDANSAAALSLKGLTLGHLQRSEEALS
ncbi:MAG TPA: hypothetical protein VFU69_02615, partial [Ktedonobacterales bacterium]|nr:hypothetical protein [Ktedonobacterales bacterium]